MYSINYFHGRKFCFGVERKNTPSNFDSIICQKWRRSTCSPIWTIPSFVRPMWSVLVRAVPKRWSVSGKSNPRCMSTVKNSSNRNDGQQSSDVSAVGAFQENMRELADDLLLSPSTSIVVDSRESAGKEAGELIQSKVRKRFSIHKKRRFPPSSSNVFRRKSPRN